MTRLAFKFLARGARGPVSEYAWPAPVGSEPGAWVETPRLELCRKGVHACAPDELAHWLHEELWLVELEGETRRGVDCVVASRGRLVREISGWAQGGAARFAEAARDHAAELVAQAPAHERARLSQYLGDASYHLPRGSTALAAFCAAMTVAWIHGDGAGFDQDGYRVERLWQSRFIARDLELDRALGS